MKCKVCGGPYISQVYMLTEEGRKKYGIKTDVGLRKIDHCKKAILHTSSPESLFGIDINHYQKELQDAGLT